MFLLRPRLGPIAVFVLLFNCVSCGLFYDDYNDNADYEDDLDTKLQVTYELLKNVRDRLAVHPIVTYDDQTDEQPDFDNEWVVNLLDGPYSAKQTAEASGFEYVGQVTCLL